MVIARGCRSLYVGALMRRHALACSQVGSGESFLICIAAVLADFYDFVVAVGHGDFGVVGIDEGEEYDTLTFGIESAPFLCLDIEVEAHLGAVVFADYVIALAVAFYEVLAVLTFDNLGAFGYGVIAAPELDTVEHQDIGQARDFVYGQNPEGKEYQLVDKLIAYRIVPGQQLVGELERAYTRAEHHTGAYRDDGCYTDSVLFHNSICLLRMVDSVSLFRCLYISLFVKSFPMCQA